MKRVIVISESMADEMQNEFRMTKYKFNEGIKQFLHDLLVDPINADVALIFKMNGINRGKLIRILKNADILQKKENISDKDENGNPKTATMLVKFQIPKKNFNRKLRNLYIKMFEKNLPVQNAITDVAIDETTGCCSMGTDAMGGSGAGAYTAPAFGDKSTIRRGNGIGGSTSINKA